MSEVLQDVFMFITLGGVLVLAVMLLLLFFTRVLLFVAFKSDRIFAAKTFVRSTAAEPSIAAEFLEETRATMKAEGWSDLGRYQTDPSLTSERIYEGFWLDPKGVTLLVAYACKGRLPATTRLSLISLLGDARILATQNNERVDDFAGVWDAVSYSPMSLPDLVEKHRGRLAEASSPPRPFSVQKAVQTYHELLDAREKQLESLGLIRFQDSCCTVYRYTFRGAWRGAVAPFLAIDPRPRKCWICHFLPRDDGAAPLEESNEPKPTRRVRSPASRRRDSTLISK